MTRAKFKVVQSTPATSGSGGTVKLQPVTNGSDNKALWNSTPTGEITLPITVAAGFATFVNGKEYYVDFTAV